MKRKLIEGESQHRLLPKESEFQYFERGDSESNPRGGAFLLGEDAILQQHQIILQQHLQNLDAILQQPKKI